jgi:hypothetical protein
MQLAAVFSLASSEYDLPLPLHPVVIRDFSIGRKRAKACRPRNVQVCSSLTISKLAGSPSFYVFFFLRIEALSSRLCLHVTYISFYSTVDQQKSSLDELGEDPALP